MSDTGLVRREGFLDSSTVAALLENPDRFDPAPVLAAAGDFPDLSEKLLFRTLSLVPGDPVADLLPGTATAGFMLDLDPADWRSEWGGLLLFRGAGERVRGYRPVPGALTLFSATTRPMVSLITPQGAGRTSILGWWA